MQDYAQDAWPAPASEPEAARKAPEPVAHGGPEIGENDNHRLDDADSPSANHQRQQPE